MYDSGGYDSGGLSYSGGGNSWSDWLKTGTEVIEAGVSVYERFAGSGSSKPDIPAEAVRVMIPQLTAIERQYLEAVWNGNGWRETKGPLPWGDPAFMALMANGGENGKYDSRDEKWRASLLIYLDKYASPGAGGWAVPPATGTAPTGTTTRTSSGTSSGVGMALAQLSPVTVLGGLALAYFVLSGKGR